MTKPNRASLTVDRLGRLGKGETLWDTNVRGLCARRRTADAVTFYVKYRTEGRRLRWYKIGQWKSPWQPDTARVKARQVLADRDEGIDPQANRESRRIERTVTDVLTAYINETGKAKRLKPATLAEYTRLRDKIIAPAFGRTRASELTTEDIDRFHKRDLGDRPYLANRVLALIRAAYNAARYPANPAKGVVANEEVVRQRVADPNELKRIATVMRHPKTIEREGVYAIAAVAFLLLTGRRKGEALKLKHADLNGTIMAVPDHKASRKRGTAYYALSAPTIRLLKSLPRIEGNPYVFPSTVTQGGHFVAIDETWNRIRTAAGLPDMRIHDLRRTHSTHAANLGVEILSTSKMLGHSSVKVTEQVYTQVQAKNLAPVANRVAGSLDAILKGKRARKGAPGLA